MSLRQQAWEACRAVAALREGKTLVHAAAIYKLATEVTGKPWVDTTDDDHRQILKRFGDDE